MSAVADDLNRRTRIHYLDRLKELSISMFEWRNLPPEIDSRYLETLLFSNGNSIFFHEKELDQYVIMKMVGTAPFDIYMIPQKRRGFANNGYNIDLTKDDSVIIYNNMLRTPAQIDVEVYADRLANLDRTVDINVNAQKTPVMIVAGDDKERTTMLNLYRQYDGNEPYIFAYNGLNDKINALKTDAPFNAPELHALKVQIWNEALTYLGISNLNVTKKERLITDEVARNQGGVIASRYSRLESRRTACKLINEMFGLDIWVDYREDYQSSEIVAVDTLYGEDEDDTEREPEINEFGWRTDSLRTDEDEPSPKEVKELERQIASSEGKEKDKDGADPDKIDKAEREATLLAKIRRRMKGR